VFVPSSDLLTASTHAARQHEVHARGRIADLVHRPARTSVRRAVGLSLVRIGARLAADPSPEPARS
jgi:hypothetical protein